LQHLGQAYQDNRAVLQYELALRRLQVAEQLVRSAPRPIVVKSEGGDTSALSTLLLARLLPQALEPEKPVAVNGAPKSAKGGRDDKVTR
jgi:hypothetical protein